VKAVEGLGAGHRAATAAGLRIRVGVNTGPVVVGIVGTDTAHEYTAMGDAVNIAARMQSHAEPGTVLITAATHRFIAPLVEARDIGAVELKGKADAVHAYAIRGLKPGAATPRGLAGCARRSSVATPSSRGCVKRSESFARDAVASRRSSASRVSARPACFPSFGSKPSAPTRRRRGSKVVASHTGRGSRTTS